jgi:D-3-phosphoglycerate dehydrogenase
VSPRRGGTVVVTDHPFGGPELERELVADAGFELVYEGDVREPERIVVLAADADAMINCYSQIPREVIEGLASCRIIARYGVGVDTIDLAAATERGIVVTNVPDYCVDEVSDHALALLLALARRLPKLQRATSGGSWSSTDAKPVRRLRESVLGLVGFGRIAREVARKGQALGLRVVACDPFIEDDVLAAAGVDRRDLEGLLTEADFVSVHVPLSPETRHIIDQAALARMKPTAYLINTSRGALVDTAALRVALHEGRLAGAGLDVLEDEPPAAGEPLLAHENVVVTPHTAFYSEESLVEMRRKCVAQVLAVLRGDRPDYPVNPEVLERSAKPQ